jgi:hypothetical protein
MATMAIGFVITFLPCGLLISTFRDSTPAILASEFQTLVDRPSQKDLIFKNLEKT